MQNRPNLGLYRDQSRATGKGSSAKRLQQGTLSQVLTRLDILLIQAMYLEAQDNDIRWRASHCR